MQQVQEPSDEASPQTAEMTAPPQAVTAQAARPDKFQLETRLIEFGAALSTLHQLFRHLERDIYLFTFGRYDE